MKQLLLIMTVFIALSSTLYAQKDTVYVDGFYESNYTEGTLNAAIADVKANGDINNTVFKLTPYEVYVLSSSIFMDIGENLEIVAPKPGDDQESAPPQIVWTDEEIDRAYIIQTYGDVTLKNVWLRFESFSGTQLGTSITFEDSLDANDTETGIFEGVIFDYFGIGSEGSGAISVKADHFTGIFRDSYFRNGSDDHFQYYGRAVSFPYQSSNYHYDYLLFENTTFSNLSRIVMMEGNEYGSNIHLNHVTMINSVEWVIQSGWLENLSITNSIFVNPYIFGPRVLDICDEGQDYGDWEDGDCVDGEPGTLGGALVQDIITTDSLGFTPDADKDGTPDFTDYERAVYIDNNVYYYTQYMQDWFTDCGWCQDRFQSRESDEIHLMSPAIGDNAMAFYDSTDSEGNKVFPKMNIGEFYSDPADFVLEPTNQDSMLTFIEYKWGVGSDLDWAYNHNETANQSWPLTDNLAYNNTTYQTAGWGGFPMGDLNWYPAKRAEWEGSQKAADWAMIEEKMAGTINSNEVVKTDIPDGYALEQNYPNPFNPSTKIAFSLPNSGNVTLKVYNTLGREVATLVNGVRQAGSHEVTFDASGLSSGIYYYRLEAKNAGVSIAKKLTLIK